MAKLIKTDGSVTDVAPKNGKDFKLDELRELIGCEYIEIVRVPLTHGKILIVDEEGKLNGKEFNERATVIYGNILDYIVGDALMCDRGEVK